MEIINGYTIIASLPTDPNLRVILGAQQRGDVFHYVTAVAYTGEVREWHWGRYFDSHSPADSARKLAEAVEDLADRARVDL